MGHFRCRVQRGFTGHENHFTSVSGEHGAQIVAGQSHAAHDIHVKQSLPGLVGLVKKANGFVNAEIVDQDIHFRELLDSRLTAVGRSIVGDKSVQFGVGNILFYRLDRRVDARPGAAIDDDVRPFSGKRACNFKADSSG